jgi:hypothetical protein
MVNADVNRRIIAENLKFLFLFSPKVTKIDYCDFTLRETVHVALVMEIIFDIVKIILSIVFAGNFWRSSVPQIYICIISSFQLIVTVLFLVFSFKKNDFKRVHFLYNLFTILFYLGIFSTLILDFLSIITDRFEFMIIVGYILYYVIEYNITYILFVFTQELGKQNFAVLDDIADKRSNEIQPAHIPTREYENADLEKAEIE